MAQDPSPARMIVEAAIVRGLEQAGFDDLAKELLVDTIARSRSWGHRDFFAIIAEVAGVVARLDRGETLWLVHQNLREVNAWWGGPNSAATSEATGPYEKMTALNVQLRNDHVALMMARKQLNGEGRADTELVNAFRITSDQGKMRIFGEANSFRSRYWRENKAEMERTIPIFRALIDADRYFASHEYFGALGWALHDQAEPDYAAAKASLERAIDLMPGDTIQPYYQLVRALCNIRLDTNFLRGEVSERKLQKAIISDIQYAERSLTSIVANDPLISEWLKLNRGLISEN